MLPNELVLITVDSVNNHQCSIIVLDSAKKNIIHHYKGGGTANSHTLDRIGRDYVVTADNAKPLLHIWPANSSNEVKNQRFVVPAIVSALAVSPDGIYLAAGIESKVYVWHLSSGRLLAVEQKHFQTITCIRFSSDGNCLIVGGKDGKLVVWKLGNLVSLYKNVTSQSEMGHVEPMFTKMDHTSSITDISVGSFQSNSMIVTVGKDGNMFLYKLIDGTQLLHCVFDDDELLSCALANTEWFIYIGTKQGFIYQIDLTNPPRTVDFLAVNTSKEITKTKAHENEITCLSLANISNMLVSGSKDGKIIIWEISSKTLNKYYEVSNYGTPSNVEFIINNENILVQDLKPILTISALQKTIDMDNQTLTCSFLQQESKYLPEENTYDDEENISMTRNREETIEEMQRLKNQNKIIYEAGSELIKKYYNVEQ